MKKLKLFLAIFILLLVFAAACVWSYLDKRVVMNPPGTIGNTAGNLNNGGYFCEDEERVYFANAYDNYTLYSMSPDETDITKLSDSIVSSLNAGGEYLYYFQNSSAAADSFASMFHISGIYRSKKNGKSTVCLKRVTAPTLSVADNTVYYQAYDKTSVSLRRIDINKKNDTQLADYFINPSCIQNGRIYFGGLQDDHYLHTLDTDSGASAVVYDGNLYNPVVAGDYVYYMDVSSDYRLCRYSLSSQSAEVLTNDRVDTFNVCGDLIYYQKNDAKSPALKRIRLDGSGEEIVSPGIFSNINATSRYVYFNAFDTPTPVYHTPVNGPVNVGVFSAAAAAVPVSS